MDPFRDELAAAHAKIAQLEERVNYLQNALRTVNDMRNAQTLPAQQSHHTALHNRPWFIGVVLTSIAFVAGLGVSVLLATRIQRSATRAASSAEYKGIATAELPQGANAISSPVDPTSASSAKPNAKPCNCTPGDPLCSCL
ncbi:MAG: hypothetical protein ABI183_04930 [Polyangiaceae bacterium]